MWNYFNTCRSIVHYPNKMANLLSYVVEKEFHSKTVKQFTATFQRKYLCLQNIFSLSYYMVCQYISTHTEASLFGLD